MLTLALPTHQRPNMTEGSQTSADGCPVEEGSEPKVATTQIFFSSFSTQESKLSYSKVADLEQLDLSLHIIFIQRPINDRKIEPSNE